MGQAREQTAPTRRTAKTDRSIMATFTARKKILKEKGVSPDSFEESVAQALFDLEATSAELKGDLRDLYIMSAKEVDVSGGRKAVVIHIPFRLRKGFQKISERLVRELEQKLSGKHVVLVAQRKLSKPPKSGYSLARPRSRSLTAVHESLLNDVCYPTEIVGKRTRFAADGTKTMICYLDKKEKSTLEGKLETFSAVYKALTGKDVWFGFQD